MYIRTMYGPVSTTCIHEVTALGVLCCLVCLFDLACFFLPSFSSLIKTCTCCVALPCLFVSLTVLACLFLLSSHLSLKHVHTCIEAQA